MSSELIVGAFSLGGVALGFLGNLARDMRSDHKAQKDTTRETMSAARHVWYEVAEFKAATDAAASVPSIRKSDLIIGPLRSREQLTRYGDRLASEETVDFGAVQEAYAATRFAAAALLADGPPGEIRDRYRASFEEAMTTLRPLAKLADRSTSMTPEEEAVRPPSATP